MLIRLARWRTTTVHGLLICAAGAFAFGVFPASAQPPTDDSAAVATTIDAFHAALVRGDAEAAIHRSSQAVRAPG